MINRERLTKGFCELVEIDSESFNERKMADRLTSELIKLGFEVNEDNVGELFNGNAGNLYGILQGSIEGEPILFSAHMDTVVPGKNKKAIVSEDGIIRSSGDTVLGADDLSGIVSILEAIRTIKENNIPHRTIEVLFPIGEEVYIRGSEAYDYSQIISKQAYVLDLSGPIGTAAISAPTLIAFKAEVIGKAAHSGFAPEDGVHAISIAAEFINKTVQGRIGDDLTVNIGKIEGGSANNIVPDSCKISGEVRSLSHEKAIKTAQELEESLTEIADQNKARYNFDTEILCYAYNIEKENPLVKSFEKACNELEIPTNLIKTFGGSDNNNFMKNNITGIVIACGMNNVHSTEEYTSIDDLYKCTNIVFKLMTKVV